MSLLNLIAFSFFLSFLIFIIFFSFDEKKVFFVHPFHQHLTCYGHLCMYKKTIYPLDSCDPLLHITSTLSTLFLYIFTFGRFAQFKHWICELNLLFNTIREYGYKDPEIKHEYLRSRASICLSLSSPFSVIVVQL